MKELSIEEKAHYYDKAIERAKSLIGDTIINESGQHIAEVIFPELAEPEDERIRKEIMELVMQPTWKTEEEFHRRNELCTWLEKQGEQSKKHDVCDTCDEKDSCISPCCVKLVEEQGGQKPVGFNIGDEITVNGQVCRIVAVDNLDWSKEDEEQLSFCCAAIELSNYSSDEYRNYAISFLESLKDRVQQQPKQEWSEEDEAMWAEISDLLWEGYKQSGSKFSWDDIRNWANSKLKYIKPQKTWKPSENELEVLRLVAEKDGTCLMGLYQQLKKLREE